MPATTRATRSKAYGIVALLYSVGVVAYEIVVVVAAFTAGGLDYGDLEALLPGLPFVVLSGIAVCIATSRFAPRGRVFPTIGGVLMILPIFGLFIGT